MLELKNITKQFPGVKALDDVSLQFKAGEIHALLGENGAGKSTIMNIICGNYKADQGEILIDGIPQSFKSYQDAIEHQISIVNQEIQVVSESTVAENIMLDKLMRFSKNGVIQWKQINQTAEKYIKMVGLEVYPKTVIATLSAAQKQLCQIAKALSTDAKYLLLDEPTSSLTIHEAENLFMLLRKLKETGVTIIFVSHKLEEVLALCDCISVLRDGKFVATRSCENLQKHEIVQMMIGREAQDVYFGALEHQTDETMLEVKNLCQKGRFDNINFSLKKGEILGFYGLVGSGRTELAKIIIGEDRMTSGEIFVNGKLAHITSVADCLEKYKIGYVSENRKEDGLILDFSIKDNITITVWKRLAKWFTGFVHPKQIDAITEDMVDSMNIKTPTLNQLVRNLSGGNQQKVCIGKWLAANCDILIIDEPTVGVDVGAKQQIHDLIWNLANQEGKTILLISSDMTEMVALARRIFVFRESKLAGEVTNLDEYKGNYQEISKKIGQYLA